MTDALLDGTREDGVGTTGVVGVLRTDPGTYAERDGRPTELPTDHSPASAPVLDPTVRTGVVALVTAAGAWLRP